MTTESSLKQILGEIKSEAEVWNSQRKIVRIFKTDNEGMERVLVKATGLIVSSLEQCGLTTFG